MDPIKKNKRILALFLTFLIAVGIWVYLSQSTFTGKFQFAYLHNRNTGEPVSALASLLLYILAGAFLGTIPCSAMTVLSIGLYFFLHRGDQMLFLKNYHPAYEEELNFAVSAAFRWGYAAVFALVALHISGIIVLKPIPIP